MDSLSIMRFEQTLKQFISGYQLPAEAKRLVLKEIYDEVKAEALNEALAEAKEMEEKDADI